MCRQMRSKNGRTRWQEHRGQNSAAFQFVASRSWLRGRGFSASSSSTDDIEHRVLEHHRRTPAAKTASVRGFVFCRAALLRRTALNSVLRALTSTSLGAGSAATIVIDDRGERGHWLLASRSVRCRIGVSGCRASTPFRYARAPDTRRSGRRIFGTAQRRGSGEG